MTWTAANGWTTPATCAWACDATYVQQDDDCVPAPACTAATEAADCPNGGACVEGACLASKQVPCTSVSFEHATNTTADVTITWTSTGGWTAPAQCAWTCDAGYEKNTAQNACVCTPGCNGNVFCSASHVETNCSDNHCDAVGGGCAECVLDEHCPTGLVCNDSNACSDSCADMPNPNAYCVSQIGEGAACDLETEECVPPPALCGNGSIDSGDSEVCDGEALGGETCESQGFASGTLACANDCLAFDTSACVPREAATPGVVISQVYGAGNNSGATLQNDYVELFNQTNSPVDLDGWSIHYAGAKGTSWSKYNLTGTISANGYFLIKAGGGTANGDPIAHSDIYFSGLGMAAAAGKVLLSSAATNLTGDDAVACPTNSSIVDFVAFGTTASDCSNTVATGRTPAPSATLAVFRKGDGCVDTNSNTDDWTTGTPAPRSSQSPTKVCFPEVPCEAKGCTGDVWCSGAGAAPIDCAANGMFCTNGVEGCFECVHDDDCDSDEICNEETYLCEPKPIETVPVGWCQTQSDNSSFSVDLNSGNTSRTFYGQVYVADVTNNPANRLQAKLFVYSPMVSPTEYNWFSQSYSFDGAYHGQPATNNQEYSVTLNLSDFSQSGQYYYTWAFSADDGNSWYYCELEPSGEGGAHLESLQGSYESSVFNDIVERFSGQPPLSVTSFVGAHSEQWTDLPQTASMAAGTFASVDLPGITWSFNARTIGSTTSNMAFERGLVLDNNAARHLTSPALDNGIGSLSIQFGKGSGSNSVRCIKVTIGETVYKSPPFTSSSTNTSTAYTISNIDASAGSSFKIEMNTANADGCAGTQLMIGEISWTDNP
ncbi:MAG: lamin tail domain-containing protein [Myxococcales bacterium]|nr:lamin tail domain-containing protein [Myxococcales bacterium]